MDVDLSTLLGQVIYLDFDGADSVDYIGPVVVKDITIPAFDASHVGLAGYESYIINSVIEALNTRFSEVGATFTQQRPTNGPYSTIYVGGNDSAFSQHGSFFGLAQHNDTGNSDLGDVAQHWRYLFGQKQAIRSANQAH